MKRYLIYLRVSTKDQDERTQLHNCLASLKQRVEGELNYLVFADKITSRKGIFKREGSKAMLSIMQPGDTIVAVRIDRLSRKQNETMQLIEMLDKKKVDVILLDQPGATNKIMLGIYSGMAEEEIITLKKRVHENFAAKRGRNERIGTVPYGYALDETQLVPIRKDQTVTYKKGILVPHPYEQQVLSHMNKLFDEGLAFRQIAKQLTRLGYTNRVGKPFQHISIHRILSRLGKTRPPGQPHVVSESLLSPA